MKRKNKEKIIINTIAEIETIMKKYYNENVIFSSRDVIEVVDQVLGNKPKKPIKPKVRVLREGSYRGIDEKRITRQC